MRTVTDPVELVDHRPARVRAVVVHAAEVEKHVEPERLLGVGADLGDAVGIGDLEGRFAAELGRGGDESGERFLEADGQFEMGGHGT